MAGVTVNGFVPKRFNEVIESLKNNAKPIFQDLVKPGEEVDTSDTSTIGRLIGLIAPDMDELWQAAQQVYQAFDPNSATGVALENVVQYIGVVRRQGRPTVLRASVWGQLGITLPSGQVIKGGTNDQFRSTTALEFNSSDTSGLSLIPTSVIDLATYGFTFVASEGVFPISYTASTGTTSAIILNALKVAFDGLSLSRYVSYIEDSKLYITSTDYFTSFSVSSQVGMSTIDVKKRLTFNSVENGDIEAPLNTVTTIVTPVYGWNSVNNEVVAERGSTYETDEELRERFRLSKAVRAGNMADALYSQMLELEDVEFVRIYENMTDVEDIRGLPPHSFMTIVEGGVATNIGEIIWNNKPAGIATYGNTSVVIRDSQNMEKTINFGRATKVPIYINLEIKKTGTSFPEDGVEKIRQALVDYINNSAIIGEDVIYTRLFTPINTVPDFQVDLLEIGKEPDALASANIEIDWLEIPITQPGNITITVVS